MLHLCLLWFLGILLIVVLLAMLLQFIKFQALFYFVSCCLFLLKDWISSFFVICNPQCLWKDYSKLARTISYFWFWVQWLIYNVSISNNNMYMDKVVVWYKLNSGCLKNLLFHVTLLFIPTMGWLLLHLKKRWFLFFV